jgi:hypothetical protein
MPTELKKVLVLERVPPGDRWSPTGDKETSRAPLWRNIQLLFA